MTEPAPGPATTASPEQGAAPDSAPDSAVERSGFLGRLTDRINPILVREVHQALNGRAFVATGALALLAIVIIALMVASEDEFTAYEGMQAFVGALQVLAPILLFIVPFQAFLSMRSEVGSGTVEHLLMSRLSPGAIVRGKLMAATVQFVIYLAIFSPLLGLTFLLRGVDVPTIAVMLTLAFVMALGSAAVGIACGALCRWHAFFRVLPFAIVLLGLGSLTIMSTEAMDEMVRAARFAVSRDEFTFWFASFCLPALAGIVLCAMVGSAVLAHRYANTSTKFRLYAIGFLGVAYGWILYRYFSTSTSVYASPGMLTRRSGLGVPLGDLLAVAAGMGALVLGLFPLFAATEPGRFTPRARTRVPRNPVLALLSAPFLPGGGRGMLFSLILAAFAVTGVWALPLLLDAAPAKEVVLAEVTGGWLYVLLYSGIAGFFRTRLADTDQRSWLARGTLPVLLLLSVLGPLLVRVVVGSQLSRGWSPLHLLNPFFTMETIGRPRFGAERGEILLSLTVACFVVLLLNLPSIVRSLREVLTASRERRQREA